MRTDRPLLATVFPWLVAVVLACAANDDASPRAPELGKAAPEYRAISLAGDSVSLAQMRGRVVLLNVWATWCHPCRDEIPVLQALHERYASAGLSLVGVSVDARGEEDTIREFATDFRMTYPLWLDPDERVQSTFLAIGVPATFLIDRSGILRWRHVGPVRANDATLMHELERALQTDASAE